MLKLSVEKRESNEDVKQLREQGIVPAVVYGPKQEAISIKLSEGDFIKLYREAGESTIINLDIAGEEHEVLVHEVTLHAVTGKVEHVDFYAIERGKKLTINVPLEFTGSAPAEKDQLIVVKVMHEIEIEARPRDLPQHIEVSLESLVDVESQIQVKDLKLPEGVAFTDEPEEVVAVVQAPKEEVEEEPSEIDMSAIEVEGEKKEESSDDSSEGESSE